jgi:AcrR family transcriptional regulator
MTVAPGRPLRADAERNRRKLLDAAAEMLAERGLDVSVAEIARRAGVGQGTVFRRFPTKDDLLAAVLADRLEGLADAVEEAAASEQPLDALRRVMELGVELQSRDRGLCEAVAHRFIGDPAIGRQRRRLLDAVGMLLSLAQDEGAVRDDVTPEDLGFLIDAVAQATMPFGREHPDLWRRYLSIVADGLRPGGTPLSVPALTADELEAACVRVQPDARR